jgi:hypothetical protein
MIHPGVRLFTLVALEQTLIAAPGLRPLLHGVSASVGDPRRSGHGIEKDQSRGCGQDECQNKLPADDPGTRAMSEDRLQWLDPARCIGAGLAGSPSGAPSASTQEQKTWQPCSPVRQGPGVVGYATTFDAARG